jgi:hypothetical protein
MLLRLPTLRADQVDILKHPAHTKVVTMGRRWGKTFMSGSYGIACANRGGAVAWVVPTYKNARAPWRLAEMLTAPVSRHLRINRTERVMEFPSGGRLAVYSADNDVALRGEAFDVVIVDEAAMVREETYTDVLLPTLADRDGRILLISTPKGRNWFWREWVRGVSDTQQIASFQAPTSNNPIPSIRRAAELARERVSDRTYRQEWLAEFVEDGGGVFRGVRRSATATAQAQAHPDHAYVIGVDWGRTHDATVITVLDTTIKAVACLERLTQTDYGAQTMRLRAVWERFGRPLVAVEQNSMGGPLLEQLSREGMSVRGFQTTAASKATIIDALALAFEREEIRILDDPALIAELEAFARTTLPSGAIRYAAPDALHDDYVISLAIAWHYLGRASSAVGAFAL